MLVEEVRLSRSIMQRNYSHCPLKKRPVPLSAREERPPAVTYKYEQELDDNEPENLSTKPEDLSRTGNYPSKASSPAVGAAPAPSPPRYWYSMPAQSPVATHLQPQVPAHVTSAPLSPYLPTHLPAQLPAHLSAHLSAHLPAHLPTHLPVHLPAHFPAQLPPYPSRPVPLEPLNLNSPTEQYCSWPRPSPPYTTYLPTGYPESYSGLSPRTACSPPAHSRHLHSPHSPHSPRSPRSPHSPPALSPASLSSGPTSPGAGELSPPGSVSSDSGISAGSVPRRRRESAARYQCPDCGKSYSTYSGLSKHSQFHCAAAEGNLAKKSFSCKYCSKVYTSLGALKMHIRTHTLPCKCHLCGKAFSRPWLLQGHIRTHTGEKPFSCHHCRRAFADRSNLRAHLQTHSEVKKYSCVSCSKTFSRMSLLSKHLEGGCPGYCPSGAPPPYEYRPEEMAAY